MTCAAFSLQVHLDLHRQDGALHSIVSNSLTAVKRVEDASGQQKVTSHVSPG